VAVLPTSDFEKPGANPKAIFGWTLLVDAVTYHVFRGGRDIRESE
jgi:hypothetical protein